MAMNDNLPLTVWFQVGNAVGQFAHRDQRRTANPAGLVLSCFAAVDEEKVFLGIQPPLDRGTIDFDRERSGHAETGLG